MRRPDADMRRPDADMRRPDADMRRNADPTTDGTDRGEGGDRSKGRVPGDPGVGVEVRHPRSGARPAGRWSGSGSTGLGPVPTGNVSRKETLSDSHACQRMPPQSV